MKTFKKLLLPTYVAAFCFLFVSCQKEATSKSPFTLNDETSLGSSSVNTSVLANIGEVSSLYDSATGTSKIYLRPGQLKGQDSWLDYMPDNPIYAAGMPGEAPELKAAVWTIGGSEVYTSFLIRFDSLSKIPAGMQVLAAKLVLFSLDSSPVALPQGNSCYPGSPYGEHNNQMLVQRVTSPWNESTVSYNTKPTITTDDEITTKASTKQWADTLVVDVTPLVKPMVQNPAENYGFMFQMKQNRRYRSMGFYSSDSKYVTKRPVLMVEYK